ncbi:MAG TPA: TetR/AcrR family transcriptional regulator [Kribbellaceae bacterium]|nr:TetR/AcrR family transcriptional regulator [Kribbellaceae bacterium]
MGIARDDAGTTTSRRAPSQRRSRERVEKILDAAERIIVEDGADALTTRSCAARAGVPVASLYQYFADRDEIVLSLVQRDIAEMDAAVAAALGRLETLTVRGVIEATMRAYVEVYHRRPAFAVIWWRGRTSAAVYEFGREHNRQTAKALYDLVTTAGLVRPDVDLVIAELAVEVGDRVFQLAFEDDLRGDERLIAEGIDLVSAYIDRFATPAGRTGVPGPAATG